MSFTSVWRGGRSRGRTAASTLIADPGGKKTSGHFSLFEVWDNITEAEVAELEGLFRHIYRKDVRANPLNVQKGFKKLQNVGKKKLEDWKAT